MLTDPRLSCLDAGNRAIWCDASVRRQILFELNSALRSGGNRAASGLIRRIDNAVVAGLEALDLPRGPVRSVGFREMVDRGWKSEECEHLLSRAWLEEALQDQHSDSVFRTWIHESIHARAAFRTDWNFEYRHSPGFEEGLAEGLAQIVTRDLAHMRPRPGVGEPFCVAYECLASVLGRDLEALLRDLWLSPCGEVRTSLLEQLLELAPESDRTEDRSRSIIKVADDLFSRARQLEAPNRVAMFQLWKRALE